MSKDLKLIFPYEAWGPDTINYQTTRDPLGQIKSKFELLNFLNHLY